MEKYIWNLTHLYADTKEWEKDTEEIKSLLEQIKAMKGKITADSSNLLKTLNLSDSLGEKLTKVYVYAKMLFDENMSLPESKKIFETAELLAARISDEMSFVEPELLTMDETKFGEYADGNPDFDIYLHTFEVLFRKKKHILPENMEELMARMNATAGSFEKIYDDLTVNDIEYPVIAGETGEKMKATNANYGKALISRDRTLRKNFFTALLGIYGKHINTITSTYYGAVKNDVAAAKTRNYGNAREMAMSADFIPETVYDNLVRTVKENTAPLQEYVRFRKKTLGLDEIHFYDLFVPITESVSREYSFEEAKEIVLKALAPLGEDYLDILRKAFAERWIDVYPGENKVSGAYAISSYGTHPFSLLNFNGTLNDIFTLAHELGHVMHSWYSEKTQPFVNADYTIFCAEVASTVNEQLLQHWLLENTDSKEEKAFLLSHQLDGIRSTFYRQTMFADFEALVHSLVENDIPLTPDLLSNEYRKLYETYHGKDFVIDGELTFEWARIPHFYSAFYVYQYATGISAAIAIAEKILSKKAGALENYRDFLTKGGSDYSISLLRSAGADMTASEPVLATVEKFRTTLEELKKLTA